MFKNLLTVLALSALPLLSYAAEYTVPPPGMSMIGHINTGYIKPGENIWQLARESDIGFYEILQANPHVNPQRTYPWQQLTIPTAFLLPDAPRQGIVVNIAELRLYYYPENTNKVYTYPVAIGMQGMATPVGQYPIIEKIDHPKWYVPKGELAEMAKQGIYLPKVMDSNEENPLGYYALRLSKRTYLLHGTNTPPTVGRRASAGCMHLYPEDIKALFDRTDVGETVTIVDQPFIANWVGDTLYFQAVQPLHEDLVNWSLNEREHYTHVINDAAAQVKGKVVIDWAKVKQMMIEPNGIPEPIGHLNTVA
jgi:L,D-transpeptidase ErfK/SrfK